MTLFFTSDTHFGHANIIKYCHRPYASVEDMDEALIDNWNKTVGPNDEIWHLGDVAFKSEKAVSNVLRRLNGKKFYIRGNHDKSITPEIVREFFEAEYDYHEMSIGKQKLVLCHYPIFSWNGMYHGSWMLHGHCHGNVDWANANTTRLDVGVDPSGYFPISFDEVADLLADRVFEKVDHHG